MPSGLLIILTIIQLQSRFCWGNEACDDKHSDCKDWALSNECEDNPVYMRKYCKRACRVCESVCEDKYSNCTKLAEEGECYFFNFEWMRTNCRLSCRYCKPLPVCEDKYSNCTKLAEEGECYFFNFEWMRTNCKLSCKYCEPLTTTTTTTLRTTTTTLTTTTPEPDGACKDKSSGCDWYYKNGHCGDKYYQELCPRSCAVCEYENACEDKKYETCNKELCATGDLVTLYENCPFTCGFCHPDSDGCQNIREREYCVPRANNGMCFLKGNQVYMGKVCAKSCKLCKAVEKLGDNCYDLLNNCPLAVWLGRCKSDPGYMKAFCPRSCGYCDDYSDKCADHGLCEIFTANLGGCDTEKHVMRGFCRKKCGHCPETSDNDCKKIIPTDPYLPWCITCVSQSECEIVATSQHPVCKRRDEVSTDVIVGPLINPKECLDCNLRKVASSSGKIRCSGCLFDRTHFLIITANCVYDWRFSHSCVDFNDLANSSLDDAYYANFIDACEEECTHEFKMKSVYDDCIACVDSTPHEDLKPCGFVLDGKQPRCINKIFGKDQSESNPMIYNYKECTTRSVCGRTFAYFRDASHQCKMCTAKRTCRFEFTPTENICRSKNDSTYMPDAIVYTSENRSDCYKTCSGNLIDRRFRVPHRELSLDHMSFNTGSYRERIVFIVDQRYEGMVPLTDDVRIGRFESLLKNIHLITKFQLVPHKVKVITFSVFTKPCGTTGTTPCTGGQNYTTDSLTSALKLLLEAKDEDVYFTIFIFISLPLTVAEKESIPNVIRGFNNVAICGLRVPVWSWKREYLASMINQPTDSVYVEVASRYDSEMEECFQKFMIANHQDSPWRPFHALE